MTMIDEELKSLAMRIAAQMPTSRVEAMALLGLIEDLLDWRGYTEADEEARRIASDSLTGKTETSPQ